MKTIIVTNYDKMMKRTDCHAYFVEDSQHDEKLTEIKQCMKEGIKKDYYSDVKILTVDRFVIFTGE